MTDSTEYVVMPIPPRCSARREASGSGCGETAEVWMVAPDGKQVPGGFRCRRCGEASVTEFREKLGEAWSLVPIVPRA